MHMEKRRKNLRAQESPLAVVYKSPHLFESEGRKNLVHSIAKKEVVVNGPRPLTRGGVIFFFLSQYRVTNEAGTQLGSPFVMGEGKKLRCCNPLT